MRLDLRLDPARTRHHFFQICGRTESGGLEQIADFAFVRRDHSFENRTPGARSAGDQHLFKDDGRGGNDMGSLFEALEQRPPVVNAVTLHPQKIDV